MILEFKGQRAKLYNNLEWATKPSFIDPILNIGCFQSTDRVLDVGTGTGIIAKAISPLVKEVIGIDISKFMLELCSHNSNIQQVVGDIRKTEMENNSFDKIVARQTFHHILTDTQKAVDNCYRMLKINGRMIIAEGVPPTLEIKPHYERVFALKEERLVFMEQDLVNLLTNSGFKNTLVINIWQKQMSIRNWLTNSGLPQKTQDSIFQLFPANRSICVKAYKMTEQDGDCFIDMKQAIVTGWRTE